MASIQFGTWFVETKPAWEEKLDYMSEYEIKQTGMSRNELKKLLKYLDEKNIIR